MAVRSFDFKLDFRTICLNCTVVGNIHTFDDDDDDEYPMEFRHNSYSCHIANFRDVKICLLYTSDAADD